MCFLFINLFMCVYVVEAKLQVLANLTNFAYDPINFESFRTLNIIDLFLGKFYRIVLPNLKISL